MGKHLNLNDVQQSVKKFKKKTVNYNFVDCHYVFVSLNDSTE